MCIGNYLYLYDHEYFRPIILKLMIKLTLFAFAIYFIVPVSVKVTNLIESTFEESLSQTFQAIDEISKEAEKVEEEEDTNAFLDFLSGIGEKATELTESVKNALSIFVDAIAVLIITTCCIPIAVILFFIWIIKIIFEVNIDILAVLKLIFPKNKTQ